MQSLNNQILEVILLKDLDIIRKLGNDTRVYCRRVQLGQFKCWICSNEEYEVRYTRKARLDEHLELHPTGKQYRIHANNNSVFI